MNRKMKPMTWEEKLTDSRYQPTKDEMEEDVCINTTPETLS